MSKLRDKLLKQKEEEQSSGSSYYKGLESFDILWKPKANGTVVFDIIPYVVSIEGHPYCEVGEQFYKRKFYIHRDVGPNDEAIVCPKRSFGSQCPICEEGDRIKALDGWEAAKGFFPRERELFNIVLQEDPTIVRLMDVSTHLFGKLLKTEIDDADDDDDILDAFELDSKFSLKVRWEEKKSGGFAWFEAGKIVTTKRKNSYSADILDGVFDLDTLLDRRSYDDIKRIFGSIVDDDDEIPMEEPDAPNNKIDEIPDDEIPVNSGRQRGR